MNGWLWGGQVFLAPAFLGVGLWKLTVSKERLRAQMAWVDDLSQGTVRAVGTMEVVGAAGDPRYVQTARGFGYRFGSS
ncbi:DoxX family protein [Streptomyces sp. NPDC014724]|uniref:DoxX family protein n=1 Tax=unclassified Streptomyces TaxID=2593676 RepID=UPI003702D920